MITFEVCKQVAAVLGPNWMVKEMPGDKAISFWTEDSLHAIAVPMDGDPHGRHAEFVYRIVAALNGAFVNRIEFYPSTKKYRVVIGYRLSLLGDSVYRWSTEYGEAEVMSHAVIEAVLNLGTRVDYQIGVDKGLGVDGTMKAVMCGHCGRKLDHEDAVCACEKAKVASVMCVGCGRKIENVNEACVCEKKGESGG